MLEARTYLLGDAQASVPDPFSFFFARFRSPTGRWCASEEETPMKTAASRGSVGALVPPGRRQPCRTLPFAFALAVLVSFAGRAHADAPAKLALLLPDTSASTLERPEVAAWLDAVREQGYEVTPYDNARFLADGAGAAHKYRGLIVPDQSQTRMGEALIDALKAYVRRGGQLMLVYDAGALTSTGFYAVPRSRFSDLVGVEYVLYEELRDFTIGLGPAVGPVRVMRSLQVPPGKSWTYPETQLACARAGASCGTASFLPASPDNPGGLVGHNHGIYAELPFESTGLGLRGPWPEARHPTARVGAAVKGATAYRPRPRPWLEPDDAYLAEVESAYNTPQAVVNYGYNVLSYPSYVTRGDFDGEPLLSSPHHGLVAGTRDYGAGRVLFVNLPLVYLKLQTDGMLMHGFIDYFSRRMLHLPRLTAVPDGTGGLIMNWHLDSMAAQEPTRRLAKLGVWESGPFSIHMTAGPDTIAFGDNLGWDLPNNPVAQKFLKTFIAQGHQVASHGGWIHDYYGLGASETNAAEFLRYVTLNDEAVTAVTRRPSREYSAPEGNNPLWAISWLEEQGVKAFYFLGHTGMAPTRSWRNGTLTHQRIWAVPLTTYGNTATFEEWQEQDVPKKDIERWYDALLAFSINHSTSRLIYAHPPGAAQWPDVLLHLLRSAEQQSRCHRFRWYTLTDIARFMTRRQDVRWSVDTSPTTGAVRVSASHPDNLEGMTWVYSRADYRRPKVLDGEATIREDGTDWVVRADEGRGLKFEARPR